MVDVPKSPGWEMTIQACVLGAGEGEVGRLRQVQLVLVCMWPSGDPGGPGRGLGACRVKGRISRIS